MADQGQVIGHLYLLRVAGDQSTNCITLTAW
jgi:hypothetical protein